MLVRSIGLDRRSVVRAGGFAVIAIFIAAAVFGTGLLELVNRWQRQEEYSHGFLIPVVVVWLLWTRREAIFASFGRPSWIALPLIGFALALHVVGELSAIFILSQIGFILTLIGIVLATGGYSLLKVTFVPIVFLLFAIPLPYFIDAKLTLQLQLVSSELGASIIGLFGIPVYLAGNVIDLGSYKIAVVEACSGLRYLFPLLSLSFLAAYLFRAAMWQRAIVFLSAVPITVMMNGLRIGLTGVTMDRWGPKMAEGVLHYFEGWIIFLACAGILLAEMAVFARLSGEPFSRMFDVPKLTGGVSDESKVSSPRFLPASLCLVLLCVGGLAKYAISGRQESPPERARFATFPAVIGEWKGRASSLEPDTERALGMDDYIVSDYSKLEGSPVNLYVAYYATQRKGISPHSPSVCLPGGGWMITSLESASFTDLPERLIFNRAVIQNGPSKQIVYYWFDERGRKIASEWAAKWYLFTDAIMWNRTDGALIRLIAPVFPGQSEEAADERLHAFMKVVVPSLARYLPPANSTGNKSVLDQTKWDASS